MMSVARNYLPQGFEPGPNHVIIGRGKQSHDHAGNKKLRQIVCSKVEEYSSTTTKNCKSQIICWIIDNIRNSEPAGGFIKQDIGTKEWFDVGDFLSKDKISQTFRDLLRGSYKSSNAYKKKRRENLKRRMIVDRADQSSTIKPSVYQMAIDQGFVNHQPSLIHLMKRPRYESTNIMNILPIESSQGIHSRYQERLNLNKQLKDQLKPTHSILSSGKNIQLSNERWSTRCAELLDFQKLFGHFDVPALWKNQELFNWVVDQRIQHKCLREGKRSTLNKERIDVLNSIGFTWNFSRMNGLSSTIHELLSNPKNTNYKASEFDTKGVRTCMLDERMEDSRYDANNASSKDEPATDSSAPKSDHSGSDCSDVDSDADLDLESSEDKEMKWRINLALLESFYRKNGSHGMPSRNNNSYLDNWVNEQSTEYLNYYQGKSTSLAAIQIVQLEKFGFSKYLRKD